MNENTEKMLDRYQQLQKKETTLQKTINQKIYEGYITNRHLTKEELIKALVNDTEIPLIEDLIKVEVERIQEIEDDTDASKNPIMFGIELEFEGYDTDVQSSLIENKKEDGSVRGDGLEINLSPVLMNEENMKDFRQKAAKMMLSAIKNNCEVGASAGMHIHLSSNSINRREGNIIYSLFNEVYMKPCWDNSNKRIYAYDRDHNEYKDITDEDAHIIQEYEFECEIITVGGYKKLKIKNEEELTPKEKTNLEWIRFLHGTSEREGIEEYGLGTDGTRGWTHHSTVELRVWRTTLDYRKLTARAKVAAFWIYHVCKYKRLMEAGYIKPEEINIWTDLHRNKEVLDAYRYLAFNCDNTHCIGYTGKELMNKLNEPEYNVRAIKERSKMIKNSLFLGPEILAKELFKNV